MESGMNRSGRRNFGGGVYNAGSAFRGFNVKAAAMNMMSRTEFLRFAGISVAGLGAALAGLSGIAKAQELSPVPNYIADPGYGPAYVFSTLAAVVDTVVPGANPGTEVEIYVMDPLAGKISLGTTTKLGAIGTSTPGAADPLLGGNLPPCYQYFYSILPAFAGGQEIIDQLIYLLDMIAGGCFKDLPYEPRETIFYMIDRMAVPGLPPDLAGAAKGMVDVTILITTIIYNSELCNLMPSRIDSTTGMPIYERNADNTWPIILGSSWDQAGYPGPLIKETNYISPYPSLNVMIKGNKVVFGGV